MEKSSSIRTGAPLKFTSMEKSQSIRTGAPQNVINFEVIVMGTCTFGDGMNTCLCANKPVLILM